MSSFFGKRLKEIRKKEKVTQKEIAEDLGFTHNQISDWEIGRSIPNIEQAYKIAKYLRIDINELVNKELSE